MNEPIMDFAFPVFNRGLSSRIHEWNPGVLEYGHCDEARAIQDSYIDTHAQPQVFLNITNSAEKEKSK